MDLDDTQVLDYDECEYNETEEEQDVKEDRNQVGQLKVFRTKDFEEKIYDIFEGENFIGRDESCDVYLPRKSLSKTHACIEVSEELHLIYDDNSKNRTKRDKTILKPQVRYELHHGDMLTLADTKCQYIKGKIEQDNDDDETGSETGSESMLPKGSAIPSSNKDTSKKKDAFAADTDSETDEEKNPVNIKKTDVYSSDEKLDKPDVAEDSDQPKPIVPAFMYDSSDDDDDDDNNNERASKHEGQKSSSDIKAQMDVSADSGTLAFGLVSPGDVPIIRPTSKKMPDVENTPLTLVYSPDTQDYTPDNPSILSKGREEGSSCAPTLIYGSQSPYQEKSPIKQKGSDQPDAAELSDEDPYTSKTSHDKNVSKTQREIASCPETLPVQEIESLKENPSSDVVPIMRGTDKLKETPLNDMPKVGETPSEFNVFLPETQGFSPGNGDTCTSFCEPTQAYLQESPVDTPKDTPGEMVSDVTSIPDSQEEGEQSQSDSDVKKVLSYDDDDSATQAYTWDDSDVTGDEDDELRFQATQAYPCHLKQPENYMEPKPESFPSKENDEVEQGSDEQEQDNSPHLDMQQTIAYDVAEMDTQAYDTGKDGNTGIEPTVPYDIMDMETQAYEAETESTSPASELDNHPSATVDRDSRDAIVEPTLPYNLGTETQDFDNEKDTSKNADDGNPAIEATVPYDIEMGTQAYTGKDIEDSQTDDDGSLEQKEGKMSDIMETQAYGAVDEAKDKEDSETDDEGNLEKNEGKVPDIMETQAYGAVDKAQDKEDSETDDEGNLEKNDGKVPDIMETQAYGAKDGAQDVDKAGPSNLDDVCAETQAYGLEVQATSPATDDMIPDSDEALSQEIPLNRIGQDDDTVNNNVSGKTFTTQQVDENRDEDEGEEEVPIIVRPKRRGKGRVTQSSTEENQQPAMPDKAEGTTLKEISVEIRREARKSPNESETAPEDAGLKRPTRGKKSKRNIEVKAKVIREPSVNDSEEDEFQPDKSTRERRSTRGKTLKKKKVDDVEEETSVSKRTTARVRRSKKTEVEAKEAEDAEDEQQQTPSMTEKKVIRSRRSKKPEFETKVPEDTEEEQQETASMTEKRRGRHPKKSEAEIKVPEDTEEEQQETASMTEKRRGRHPKKSEAETRAQDDTEEEEQETPPMTEKRTTRGRHPKKSEAEMKVPEDTEEEQQETPSTTEKKITRGRHLKKSEAEMKVPEDTEEEQQETASKTEKKITRGRHLKKSEAEMKVPEDTEEEQQETPSTTEKKITRGRHPKKSEAEMKVPEDTEEEQQETPSKTEKKITRGRHPKKSEAEMKVPEDTEEEQQETPSKTEKKITRGRHPKKSEAEMKVPEDTEEEQQETPSKTEKKITRGRHPKEREAEMKVPEDTEESAFITDKRTMKGRHSKKKKVEARVQEDTVEEQQESSSVSEKNSARGRRSKKSGVKPTSIEHVLPDDTDLDVPVKKSLRGRRSAKEDKEVEKEEKTPQVEEKEVSVPENLVQDSPDDEELPSLELILSEKKPTKGKGKRKGKSKEPKTPVLLSSKVEIPSVTIEVKPYFPRRGRGRVTQSDESASAVPDTSGTQLTEFEEEELISPRSVARSISARKGMKGKNEDENQEYAEMDTSVSQSTTSSPIESKTRKRGRKEEARVATDLDESQSSVASSVGRKARGKRSGKNAKASDADDIHSQSASQASDVSAASSVESRTRGKGRRKTARSGTLDDTQEQEVQETPTKKGRTIKDEADSPTVHSPSLRERKPQTPPNVMFTGVSDKQAEKIVTSLGGTLVDSVYECTHLITDKVRRTVKFLCGVASGQMIVQPQWLTACKKAKHFIEPVPFIVSDKAAEKQYSFSLQQSLEKAQSGGLLEGYKIHITKSVKPEPSQMKDIIKSAKGEYLPRMPRTNVNNVLVVSCEEDLDLCKPALACGLPVYSSELLLTGVLRQELELDQNRLFSSEEEGKRKRKEYGGSETPVKSASRKRKKK